MYRDLRGTEDNVNYHRTLAESLIKTVGYDAAIRFCHNNAWEGVLWSVLAIRDNDHEPAEVN